MTNFLRVGSSVSEPKAKKGKSGGSGSGNRSLIHQVDLNVLQGANPDTGTVTDPSVYQRQIDLLQNDNSVAGLTKKADLQNKLDALKFAQSKVYATKNLIDSNFNNAQLNIGEQYGLDPKQLIEQMYGLYNYHATQIENHLQQLQNDVKAPGTALQDYGGQIIDEGSKLGDLRDAINAKGLNSPEALALAQNFGLTIGSDTNGRIISFGLKPIPSAQQDARLTVKGPAGDSTDFIRTNATYGGIPVHVVPQTDPKDPTGASYTAKIGDLTFTGKKGGIPGTQGMMELSDKRNFLEKIGDAFPDALERLLGAGGRGFGKGLPITGMNDRSQMGQPDVKFQGQDQPSTFGQRLKAQFGTPSIMPIDLLGHIRKEHFSDMQSLPAGTIATDSTGNYYYYNDKNVLFAAPNADILGAYLNKAPKEIQSSALPISAQNLQRLQQNQDPNAAANMWLQDPTTTSPLNMRSNAPVYSYRGSGGKANVGGHVFNPLNAGNQAAPLASLGASPSVTRQYTLKNPSGQAKQQQNTREIAGGAKFIGPVEA